MRPPRISDEESLKKKIDLLQVLGDIEIAQGLIKSLKTRDESTEEVVLPHPDDANYKLLKADLTAVDRDSDEFAFIEKYLRNTEAQGSKITIMDVYAVNRHGEDERFAEHDHITERKLLWHGTSVAVMVAILSSGLRIMPHSGGRVGKGLYFASENSKSAGYVGRVADGVGVMLLNEVALGKEHHITKDDSSLIKAPNGYDSVVAQGRTEPDPMKDIKWEFEGNKVIVPQGKPIDRKEYASSYFSQTEYLVYKESQVRIRYVLKLKWG